jgi:hypothetical protein
MKRETVLKHEFVEYIPNHLKDGMIYVSVTFGTVVHKCCCGCGNEVITPLSPTDWKLTFNGESISLYPSIGNWNFDCKSHYWITNNKVEWAKKWSEDKINAGRGQDSLNKRKYYNKKSLFHNKEINEKDKESKTNLWSMLKKWWF